MGALEKLEIHARKRVTEIGKMKKNGVKVIGYLPEGFFPEELVYAAGAVPVALIKGGDYETVLESLKYIPRFICTWCRSQIAYKKSGDAWYNLPDQLIGTATDSNAKFIADMFNYWTDTPALNIGVPHNKEDIAIKYFTESLEIAKNKIEEVTGNKVTDSKLSDAIDKQNKIRSLLKSISELRKADNPPISGYEYMRLHHLSFMADPDFLIGFLIEFLDELKNKTVDSNNKIRLYLTGSTLALGDYRIYEIADLFGADFVCEEFAGGVRPYHANVENTGSNPMAALVDAYFIKRREPAWFRPSKHRVNYMIDDIQNFNAKGVVWYQILYRESYDLQHFYFESKIKNATGAPTCKIDTDYDPSEKGNIKTRIETLIEIVKGG